MLKQKPLPFSFLVLIVLAVIHLAASYFSWYWSHPWLEVVVHILGGMWVALVFLWLASYLNQINSMVEYKTKSLLIALIAAALFGVVWEILENLGQLAVINDPGYDFNTALDLFNDVVGGVFAYLYFVRNKSMKKSENVEILDALHPTYNKIGVVNETTVNGQS